MNDKILIYVVSVVSIAELIWIIFFEIRMRRVFGGKSAKDLEGLMKEISAEIQNMHESREEIEKYLAGVERRLLRSAQYVGLVRFNPFHDAGSDQSFALALMDEKKNGFVISSLYGRETSRLYGKPLIGGVSTYQLSKEETQAIELALKR